eukprot:TRINITY_DN19302_c0_g1_i1.p1 TRINITY_DN19302_c0_g1~~TRINITY_DN19302_c0_g1_i1.p1  ORF type:complete len:260 (+),score=5.31 TRINITY_DN19302_c0_g1_i1:226-1005(+)
MLVFRAYATLRVHSHRAIFNDKPVRPARELLAREILGSQRFRIRDELLAKSEVERLYAAIQASPYFGKNTGKHDFYEDTYGFHVEFRSSCRSEVENHLPYLKPAFAKLLRPECNCFYLTVLFARPDGQQYHTDNFFENITGGVRPSDLVSVFYLNESSDMRGGELVILNATDAEVSKRIQRGHEKRGQILKKIQPKAGRAVDFDGQLLHAVNAFKSSVPRASLVIEQCRLPRRHLLKTAPFKIFCQRRNRYINLHRPVG